MATFVSNLNLFHLVLRDFKMEKHDFAKPIDVDGKSLASFVC